MSKFYFCLHINTQFSDIKTDSIITYHLISSQLEEQSLEKDKVHNAQLVSYQQQCQNQLNVMKEQCKLQVNLLKYSFEFQTGSFKF